MVEMDDVLRKGLAFGQNRDLSWLRFNDRVLDEAADPTVPLMERLRFISIFTSNLDEFFMVRVGSLHMIKKAKKGGKDRRSGRNVSEQLSDIYAAVRGMAIKRDELWDIVTRQLQAAGVRLVTMDSLSATDRSFVTQFVRSQMQPLLSPTVVGGHNPFPACVNKQIYVAAHLRTKKNEDLMGILPLPPGLPQMLYLPGEGLRLLPVAQILLGLTDEVFSGYRVEQKVCFSVTRNADLTPDDDLPHDNSGEDFRESMKKLLGKRRTMAVVRLETSCHSGNFITQALCRALHVEPEHIFVSNAPMAMGWAFELIDKVAAAGRSELLFPAFTPHPAQDLDASQPIAPQVRRRDCLLLFPFESIDPFVKLLEQAAADPTVRTIKITVYRLSQRSRIVAALCRAAERGKQVTVFIELRARFDEQNNIDWSQTLEEAGCQILYGFDEYKTHCKLCQITYVDTRGKVSYITQVGTGNYNEKTCEIYTDISLLTAAADVGEEASRFFGDMAAGRLSEGYAILSPAPLQFKPRLLELIEREAMKGPDGRILMKMNSLTDIELIQALCSASCAGCRVVLNIRGICCLRPGVPGYTDNITVRSIVGRFLEHARIYCFGEGDDEMMYIASADLMTRNTERRVELGLPVRDAALRARIAEWMALILADNTKARLMDTTGAWQPVPRVGPPIDSQALMLTRPAPPPPAAKKRPWWKRLLGIGK